MTREARSILIFPLVILCGLFWLTRHPGRPPVIPPPAAPEAGVKSEPTDATPAPASVATAITHDPAPDFKSQLTLMLKTLQAWDDDDRETLRPQRLVELAALLQGTNALELVQALPAKFMGYAFAVPSVREKLLADPTNALAWMSFHPNVAGSQLSTFLQDWNGQNHDEMAQVVNRLPDGEWKQTVLGVAAGDALSLQPAEAIGYAIQINPGPTQTALLQMATAGWTAQDPTAATAWVSQITDPALRETLCEAMVTGYADVDPAQALQAATQLPDDSATKHSIGDIVWKWALRDPEAAGNYLAQLPEDGSSPAALENLINVWADHDPTATLNWIESLPAGPRQIAAAQAMQAVLPAEVK